MSVKFLSVLLVIGFVIGAVATVTDVRSHNYKSRCLAAHNAYEAAQGMRHMVDLETAMPDSPFKEKSIAEAQAKAEKAWKDYEHWRDQLGEPPAFCEPCAIW